MSVRCLRCLLIAIPIHYTESTHAFMHPSILTYSMRMYQLETAEMIQLAKAHIMQIPANPRPH